MPATEYTFEDLVSPETEKPQTEFGWEELSAPPEQRTITPPAETQTEEKPAGVLPKLQWPFKNITVPAGTPLKEQIGLAWEDLNRPIVTNLGPALSLATPYEMFLPEESQKAVKAYRDALGEIASGFTSPMMVSVTKLAGTLHNLAKEGVGAAKTIGNIGQRLVAAGFSADMIRNMGPASRELAESIVSGDTERMVKASVHAAANVVMATMAGKFAAAGTRPTTPPPGGAPPVLPVRRVIQPPPEAEPRVFTREQVRRMRDFPRAMSELRQQAEETAERAEAEEALAGQVAEAEAAEPVELAPVEKPLTPNQIRIMSPSLAREMGAALGPIKRKPAPKPAEVPDAIQQEGGEVLRNVPPQPGEGPREVSVEGVPVGVGGGEAPRPPGDQTGAAPAGPAGRPVEQEQALVGDHYNKAVLALKRLGVPPSQVDALLKGAVDAADVVAPKNLQDVIGVLEQYDKGPPPEEPPAAAPAPTAPKPPAPAPAKAEPTVNDLSDAELKGAYAAQIAKILDYGARGEQVPPEAQRIAGDLVDELNRRKIPLTPYEKGKPAPSAPLAAAAPAAPAAKGEPLPPPPEGAFEEVQGMEVPGKPYFRWFQIKKGTYKSTDGGTYGPGSGVSEAQMRMLGFEPPKATKPPDELRTADQVQAELKPPASPEAEKLAAEMPRFPVKGDLEHFERLTPEQKAEITSPVPERPLPREGEPKFLDIPASQWDVAQVRRVIAGGGRNMMIRALNERLGLKGIQALSNVSTEGMFLKRVKEALAKMEQEAKAKPAPPPEEPPAPGAPPGAFEPDLAIEERARRQAAWEARLEEMIVDLPEDMKRTARREMREAYSRPQPREQGAKGPAEFAQDILNRWAKRAEEAEHWPVLAPGEPPLPSKAVQQSITSALKAIEIITSDTKKNALESALMRLRSAASKLGIEVPRAGTYFSVDEYRKLARNAQLSIGQRFGSHPTEEMRAARDKVSGKPPPEEPPAPAAEPVPKPAPPPKPAPGPAAAIQAARSEPTPKPAGKVTGSMQKKYLLAEAGRLLDEAPEEPRVIESEARADRDQWTKLRQLAEDYRKELLAKGETDVSSKVDERMATEFDALFRKYGIPEKYPAWKQVDAVSGEPVQHESGNYSMDWREAQLDHAIARAEFAQGDNITIEVPGDGTFVVRNTKFAIKDFLQRAKKFPTTVAGAPKPGMARITPTPAAKVETARTVEGDVSAAHLFSSEDPSRFVLQYVLSDGSHLIGTDGRRMIIVDRKGPGTPEKPKFYDKEGNLKDQPMTDEQLAQAKAEHNERVKEARQKKQPSPGKFEAARFPNWMQVVPQKNNLWFKGVDTERMHRLVMQALQVLTDKSRTITIHKDAKGTLGVTANTPELGNFAGDVTETSKPIVALNGDYVLDMLNAARKLGLKTVDIRGEDEISPITMEGKGVKMILMPMRMDGGPKIPRDAIGNPEVREDHVDPNAPPPGPGTGAGPGAGPTFDFPPEPPRAAVPGDTPGQPEDRPFGILSPISVKLNDWLGFFRDWTGYMSGKSLPRITRLDQRAGEYGVRYGASRDAARPLATSIVSHVLEGTGLDSRQFGTALAEDNLMSRREALTDEARRLEEQGDAEGAERALEQAGQVRSLIGAEGSPFRTWDEWVDYLQRPDVRRAIEQHKQMWQEVIEPMFKQAASIDPSIELPSRGYYTGARVNMKAILEGEEGVHPIRMPAGPSLRRTFKRTSPFARPFKGTAQAYEGDYGELMLNTVTRQLEIANKNAFDNQLIEAGLAEVHRTGWQGEINGESVVAFPRKGGAGTPIAGRELFVPKSIAREYRIVANVDEPFRLAVITPMMDALNRAALAGLTDFTIHTSNQMTALFNRPVSGTNIMLDSMLSAFGRADVPVSIVRAMVKAFKDNREQWSDLLQIGAGRTERPISGLFKPTGKIIQKLDRVTRLLLDDAYQDLARQGLVERSETARREYVNQIGQYNKRLQGKLTKSLRELGIGPFVTAGKAFNSLGVRMATMSPGIKGSSIPAAGLLRANVLAKWVGAVVLIGTLNKMLTKNPNGRPGTPVGHIDTGKNDRYGRHITFPLLDLLGLGRALRVTGFRAAYNAKRLGLSDSDAIQSAFRDVFNAWTGPAQGPPARFAAVAATGYPAVGVSRQARVVAPGESQVGENFKQALRDANPIVHSYLEYRKGKTTPEVLQTQLTRFTPVAGKYPGIIERYPRMVETARTEEFLDDVFREARKMPPSERSPYVLKQIARLPPNRRLRALEEAKRRRLVAR